MLFGGNGKDRGAMPAPSKFKADVKQKILEAKMVGASNRTAAAVARVDIATLTRWLDKGKSAPEGSPYREFHDDFRAAEAHPNMRALGVIYKDLPDVSSLAWKFIERREPGYAPPMPQTQAIQAAPVMIHLSFHDGGALDAGTIEAFIEGEAIEQDIPAEEAVAALPAPTPA
jgi:hypothetical protein